MVGWAGAGKGGGREGLRLRGIGWSWERGVERKGKGEGRGGRGEMGGFCEKGMGGEGRVLRVESCCAGLVMVVTG